MAKEGSSKPKSHLEALHLWHRFHVRLTALYAGTVFVTLIVMGILSYQRGVEAELDSLKHRLMAIVTSLSQTIPGDGIGEVPLEQAELSPVHTELLKKFGGIADADPDIDSIYLLRPTDQPT